MFVVWRNTRDSSAYPYRLDEVESVEELSDGTLHNSNTEVAGQFECESEALELLNQLNEWASIRFGMLRP